MPNAVILLQHQFYKTHFVHYCYQRYFIRECTAEGDDRKRGDRDKEWHSTAVPSQTETRVAVHGQRFNLKPTRVPRNSFYIVCLCRLSCQSNTVHAHLPAHSEAWRLKEHFWCLSRDLLWFLSVKKIWIICLNHLLNDFNMTSDCKEINCDLT